MASNPLFDYISVLPPSLVISFSPILVIAAVLGLTRLFTSLRFYLALNSSSTKPNPPPKLPYTLPFLGQALDFLAPKPGLFWHNVFSAYPTLRKYGTCSLRLANQQTHILFTPTAVQAMFRAPLARQNFNTLLLTNALDLTHEEAVRYWGEEEGPNETGMTPPQLAERTNHEYLLKPNRVNELTKHFVEVLRDELAADGAQERELDLYAWIRSHMFKASTDAFMGTRLLEMYPDFEPDFFEFDRGFLTMFFGIPKLFVPSVYRLRAKMLRKLEAWQKQMVEDTKGIPCDPDGDVDWEPNWGSRANRARQIYYEQRSLSLKARAGMDAGFMFGASSNAIPATGWMLFHILDPHGDKTLLPRLMEELETARNPDGTVDIPTLVSLPLLTSVFHEILRLYVDVLVTREVKQDLVLPLTEGKNPKQVMLKGGSAVIAPSWLGHHDGASWNSPPENVFFAERFLKPDPETGKTVFTTSGSVGKLFPFGGGRTICPGRVFAKQEVLGSVAYVLLNFDFDFVSFVDESGKPTEQFPKLRDGFTGSGIMVMGGDLRAKLKGKQR